MQDFLRSDEAATSVTETGRHLAGMPRGERLPDESHDGDNMSSTAREHHRAMSMATDLAPRTCLLG